MSEAKNVWTPDRGIVLPNGGAARRTVPIPAGLFVDTNTGKPITESIMAPAFDAEEAVRDGVLEMLGELDDIDLAYNDVMVCKYIRQKVSASLIASSETNKIDEYQGVVGLVLKVGPRAFVDDEQNRFHGFKVERGDWVLYRHSDGWDKGIRALKTYDLFPCRLLQDAHIRAKVRFPGRLF